MMASQKLEEFKKQYKEYVNLVYASIPKGFQTKLPDSNKHLALLFSAYRAKPFAETILYLDGKSFMASSALARTLFEVVLDCAYISCLDSTEYPLADRYVEYEDVEAFKEIIKHTTVLQNLEEARHFFQSAYKILDRSRKAIYRYANAGAETKIEGQALNIQKALTTKNINVIITTAQVLNAAMSHKKTWRLDEEVKTRIKKVSYIIGSSNVTAITPADFIQVASLAYDTGCTYVHPSTSGASQFYDKEKRMFNTDLDRESGLVIDLAFSLLRILQFSLSHGGLINQDRDDFLNIYFENVAEKYRKE